MSKGKNAGRIYKQILAGEGPNGEDIERTIDRETDRVLSEVILKDYDTRGSNSGASVVSESRNEAEPDKPAVISASEMLRLALREREATFGKRVQELLQQIMEGCKSVILTGSYTHEVGFDVDVPAEVIKQAVRELKGLGYKVKVEPAPDVLATITVKWPVKEDKKGKRGRPPKTAKVVEETAAPVEAPKPKPTVTEETPDVGAFSFKGAKAMPGGRPPRPKPRKAEM